MTSSKQFFTLNNLENIINFYAGSLLLMILIYNLAINYEIPQFLIYPLYLIEMILLMICFPIVYLLVYIDITPSIVVICTSLILIISIIKQ